jgi:hypothetical protein
MSRRLRESDQEGRMALLSAGCFAESFTIAAHFFGYNTRIKINRPIGQAGHVAHIEVEQHSVGIGQGFFLGLLRRQTHRGAFSKNLAPKEYSNIFTKDILGTIEAFVSREQQDIEQFAELNAMATKNAMARKQFRSELASWLRPNLTQKKDGMPGYSHGMSLFVSLAAPFIVKHIDVSEVEKKKAFNRVMGFPAFAVLGTQSDDPVSWLETGIVLQRVLALLSSRGIQASIMAATIEDTVIRKSVQKYIIKKTQKKTFPQIFFGFGRPIALAKQTPRLNINDIFDEKHRC